MNVFKNTWIKLSILMIIPFATSGCFDRQELEQQAFVMGLGVDKAPNGLIDCSLQLALPTNPASGGSQSGTKPLAGSVPVTYRAHSVSEAILLANSSIERTLTFSHLSYIAIGRKIAEQGVLPFIQPMVSNSEFRRTIPIGVSSGTARENMLTFKPMLEKTIPRAVDSFARVAKQTGLSPVTYLHDFIAAMENPHQDVILPVWATNEAVEADPKGKSGITQDGKVSYTPADVVRSGGNAIDDIGAAVFHGDHVVGYLNGREAIYFNLLRGTLRNAKIDFTDPLDPKQTIGFTLRLEHAPNYHVQLGTPLKINIDMPADVDLTNVGSGIDYAEPHLRVQLEKGLSNEFSTELTNVVKKLECDYESDCIPISKYIRRQFPTHNAFATYPWTQRMKTADIQVQGTLHVRRFGVQIEPLRDKNE